MKLKSQANTLVLSYLWWVIEPLLYVVLFYFVFKYVLYRGGEDFFIFLMVGKIPFLWFSKSVTSGANSLVENRGLIAQRIVPKYMFPFVNCQEASYKQVIAFAVLFSVLIASGYAPTSNWWQLIPLIVLNYLLICGVAVLFSVFVSYAADFRMVIQLFMMGLMFTSGIFWDVNMIQDQSIKEFLLILNPVAALIDGYRQVLMYNQDLNVLYMVTTFAWACGALVAGLTMLHMFNNTLTRKLFS
ncbi:o-antigen export system permease protein RfbD [Pseudoalteromonas sp. SW0106-04]|uniref:ABC transporter permease n=1 Tax=Pseudoalteromonas sp. SW0106-04 TaxID=1702169 RepID=UPI0006B5130E|nr:ABC transporter permease [Pseudoalteromonas sp. SW0106-04]GAP74595.1 o-antigen export system permease protein RfbD [Pseudoalteromonas sp. SW0106-04]